MQIIEGIFREAEQVVQQLEAELARLERGGGPGRSPVPPG